MARAFARCALIAGLLAASAVAAGTPATALFDFSSREPDELSLRRGEALTVLNPEVAGEEGWAFGRTADGRQGFEEAIRARRKKLEEVRPGTKQRVDPEAHTV